MSPRRKPRSVKTHPTEAQVVADPQRINAMTAHTPITKDLRAAGIIALWVGS